MLIIGLGNIGKEYEQTYHNVGFMVVDKLLEKLGKKTKETICKADSISFFSGGEKIIIAKPTTFMNLSGEACLQLASYHHQKLEEIMIIYDDIDLPCGDIRIRKSGSGGTHNGMKNIVAKMNSVQIPRMRMGVGQPEGQMPLAAYVLSKIAGTNKDLLDGSIDKASDCLMELIKSQDLDNIMNKYNG